MLQIISGISTDTDADTDISLFLVYKLFFHPQYTGIEIVSIVMYLILVQDEFNKVYMDDNADETENTTEATVTDSYSVSMFASLLKFMITSLIVWQLTVSISNAAAIAMVSIFEKFIFYLSDALICEGLRNTTACVYGGLECDKLLCSLSIM